MNEDHEHRIREEIIMQQLAEVENQITTIESRKAELESVKQSIDDLSRQKNKDILFPIGAGVLAQGKLTDEQSLLINIGASVLIPKSTEEAKQLIDEQIRELAKLQDSLRRELSR